MLELHVEIPIEISHFEFYIPATTVGASVFVLPPISHYGGCRRSHSGEYPFPLVPYDTLECISYFK